MARCYGNGSSLDERSQLGALASTGPLLEHARFKEPLLLTGLKLTPLPNMCVLLCRCGDLSTDAVPSTVTSEEEEEEELRTHLPLPLPLSPGEDVTVECVAYNTVGLSRQIFVFRTYEATQAFLRRP